MGSDMDWEKACLIAVALFVLFLVLAAIPPAAATLVAYAPTPDSTLGVTINVVRLSLSIVYFILILFGLPQFLFLTRMGVRGRWAYAVVGVLSGWLLQFTFVGGVAITGMVPPGIELTPLGAFAFALTNPLEFLVHFYRTVGPLSLLLFGALGWGMSFLWPPQKFITEGRQPGWYVRLFLGKD